jgi:hypothetical protein
MVENMSGDITVIQGKFLTFQEVCSIPALVGKTSDRRALDITKDNICNIVNLHVDANKTVDMMYPHLYECKDGYVLGYLLNPPKIDKQHPAVVGINIEDVFSYEFLKNFISRVVKFDLFKNDELNVFVVYNN